MRFSVKIGLVIFCMMCSSLAICCLLNYVLIIPPSKTIDLNFHYTNDGKDIHSSINFNCTETDYDLQCELITDNIYSIELSLEVAKKDRSRMSDNIEIELKGVNEERNFSIKRLILVEQNNYVIDFINDIIRITPFQIINIFNNKYIETHLIDNYDNNEKKLERLDLFIKDRYLNIRSGSLKLLPKASLIKRILYYFKVLTLPASFMIFFTSQVFIYILLKILFSKNNSDYSENKMK